jgi:Zn-dependent protease with chaperone function
MGLPHGLPAPHDHGTPIEEPSMRARHLFLALALMSLNPFAAAAEFVLPTPSTEAVAFHGELFWLWLLEQAGQLVMPAWLLLSGRGASIARRCLDVARGRVWLGTLLFAGTAGALYTLSGLAVDAVREVRLTPYFAGRALDLPDWLAGRIVPTLAAIVGLGVAGCVLNLVIRRSPRWWWAWVSAAVTVLAVGQLTLQPIMDKRMRAMPRLENSAQAEWAPRIQALFARAGAHDVPVLLHTTRAGDFCPVQSHAVGLGPTRRIIVPDRIFTDWTPQMVEVSAAHELKHYLRDNGWFAVVLIAELVGMGGFAVWIVGNAIARRGARLTGFADLANPAALPLLVVLLQGYLLIAVPAFHLTAQKRELDADRFAIDLTGDRQARAAISGRKCGDLWLAEDPLFEKLYLNTHPSVGDRLRLAENHPPQQKPRP